MPFYFEPLDAAAKTLERCLAVDFSPFGGGQIDKMIGLKFPAYMIGHPDKRLWLLHQHRSAYDLYDTPHGWQPGKKDTDALRQKIIEADNARIGEVKAVYTIAERVSERLRYYNGIPSRALYHPPANAPQFRCEDALPYIFVPSRLEKLKRQDLMLQALAVCTTPVQAIFAGTGGMLPQLRAQAARLGIEDRVRFVGNVSRAEMLSLYAHATAVFFGPLDEDYGYVTLEAMLSSKPVITCTDSGGPLEFVRNGETGFVTAPEPQAIAEALDMLANDAARARALGANGRSRYEAMDIAWSHVVEALLSDEVTAANP
jgi:glycosyltransferase involved in cell wall biosynthesis